MKKFFLFALTGLLAVAFTACEPNKPDTPATPDKQDTIPSSFPKKHLIEEFTGQSCGYCPGGMDAVHEFIANDTNWVLVLHHAGYADDHFTIAEDKTTATTLKVNGAPSIAINRAKTAHKENNVSKNTVVFHPGYLPTAAKSQFETETYASVNIENTYDAATRELNVKVSGIVLNEEASNLKLTVLIKESGMIDTQADYYNTFEGWEEFRHANAARKYLTEAKGESVEVAEKRYEMTYTATLDDKWIPENCMVVAFLSEAFQRVVQAEQEPVVAGSKGGADISHKGIKKVEVADYYPEPDATKGPGDFSGNKSETLTNAGLYYEKYPSYGFTYWCIQAYDPSNAVTINRTPSVPFANIYFFTDLDASTTEVPVGEYEFATTMQPNTAYAGFRDDEEFVVDGSMFYFVSQSYLQQGYLVPSAKWLIVSGKLTITAEGWSVAGKARNGAAINMAGTGPLTIQGKMSGAPAKVPAQKPARAPHLK